MTRLLPYYNAPEKLQASVLSDHLEALGDEIDVFSLNLSIDGKVAAQLREAITAGTVSRTIEGASTLTLTIEDPDLAILRSGVLGGSSLALTADVGGATKTGVSFATPVDCELDGLYFRLVGIDKDAATRSIVLTFEDREVAVLRAHPLDGDPQAYKRFAGMNRIAVMEWLCDYPEIREYDDKGVRLVSPLLPQASTAPQTLDPGKRLVTHQAGFPAYRPIDVKVKGAESTDAQIDVIQAVLDVGQQMKVSEQLLVVAVMVITDESNAGQGAPTNVFQQEKSQGWPASGDVTKDATAFYQHAQAALASNPTLNGNYALIAATVQRPLAFLETGVTAMYGQWQPEAQATVDLYLGSDPSLPPAVDPKTSTGKTPSPAGSSALVGTAVFERGTQTNQGGKTVVELENNWACLQRLAQEVGWLCYCVSGTVYIETYPHLFSQPIRMLLSEEAPGVDGIGFEIDTGKQHATATVQCRISRWGAPPGSVVAVQGCGPADGRWLVKTIDRDLFSFDGTITLSKPQTTLKDAESASPIQHIQLLAASGLSSAAAQKIVVGDQAGAKQSVADAALRAVQLQTASHPYVYAQVDTLPASLYGPPTPIVLDCSSFAQLCYRAGDLPDPNGPKYDYQRRGDTGSLIANGTKTTSPQPGDLLFLGRDLLPYPRPHHVVVYIGNGQAVSMGHQGEPAIVSVANALSYFGGISDGYYTYPAGGPA